MSKIVCSSGMMTILADEMARHSDQWQVRKTYVSSVDGTTSPPHHVLIYIGR